MLSEQTGKKRRVLSNYEKCLPAVTMAMPNVVETAYMLKSLSLKISRILKKQRVQSEGNETNDFIYHKLPSFMTRSLILTPARWSAAASPFASKACLISNIK